MTAIDARSRGIGRPVPRKEDRRLLTGRGAYLADHMPQRAAHAIFVRSPHAHARIRAIDVTAASAMPGVLAVLTGSDMLGDGLKPIPHEPQWEGWPDVKITLRESTSVHVTKHHAMPFDVVRFVGEAVAVVVAVSVEAATAAAAEVVVDYEPLPAVAHAAAAIAAGAPLVWADCKSNVALDADVGDKAATDAAFARASHTVRLETWVQRVTGCPLEPRAATGDYDAASGCYSLHAGSGGGVLRLQRNLAGVLGVEAGKCRCHCGDMGGNFGTRNTFAPEYAVLPWAARRVGRPVKWVADRTECFLTDYQGRDLTVEAELALDADGGFLAVRGSNISNIGAYTAHFTPLRKGLAIMSGVYRIGAVHFRGRAVLTHTAPTTPYRSAGRPEAIYVIERLIDLAAATHGFDRIELRRRNLVPPDAMPFTNAVGVTYDNGEYARGMDAALVKADWKVFPARRAASRARGLHRGIGLANYVEGAGGAPRERAEITLSDTGRAELVIGTLSSGQGHETSFAQLIEEWLGIPIDEIDFVANDTLRVSAGGGSHSGRSMRIASLAIREATDSIVEKGKRIAAHVLADEPSRIRFERGIFKSGDGNRTLDLSGVVEAASKLNSLPQDLRGPLVGIGDVNVRQGAYPSGTHVCEVEVDPDTGEVRIVAWTGVDDVGLAVNPLILHGQAHGAVAQGVGQALLEQCYYDPETAQLLTASFMDYAIPRADTLPSLKCELVEVPSTSHRFGIRPGGEGGTTPALGAVVNAIVDALAELGVRHIEMPATPERVWQAIRNAQQAGAPDAPKK